MVRGSSERRVIDLFVFRSARAWNMACSNAARADNSHLMQALTAHRIPREN